MSRDYVDDKVDDGKYCLERVGIDDLKSGDRVIQVSRETAGSDISYMVAQQTHRSIALLPSEKNGYHGPIPTQEGLYRIEMKKVSVPARILQGYARY